MCNMTEIEWDIAEWELSRNTHTALQNIYYFYDTSFLLLNMFKENL